MSPKIVTRAEWGAAPPREPFTPADWSDVDLHLHHTAGPQSQTPKEIQAFHQRVRMWKDIGYHYLVRSDGTVYEGRGPNVQGAHSPDKNDEPGVALIGTYSDIDPSEAQRRSVWALKDMLGAKEIRGHRDSFPTSCPGNAAYRMIVEGGRPAGLNELEREPLPTGQLRLGIEVPGRAPRRWEDEAAWNALRWIADKGEIDYRSKVTLAWRGQGWTTERDNRPNFRTVNRPHIVRVAQKLVNERFKESDR